MDSTQSGIIPPSSPNSGAAQSFASDSGSSSETGFSRLFSMVQDKAEKIVNSYNSDDNKDRGNSRPEFGKDLPLKYATSASDQEPKGKTAVLSTSGERSTPGGEEINSDGEIKALDGKLTLDNSLEPLSAAEVPVINLPKLGEDEILEPELSVPSSPVITKSELAANEASIPTIQPAGKILSMSEAAFGDLEPAASAEPAIKASPTLSNTPSTLSSATAALGQPASVSASEATSSTVTIGTQIADSASEISGITGMNSDLKTGAYGASSEIANKNAVQVNPANSVVTNVSPQVELSQLEMRSANIQLQANAERPLVDAAFQRQVVDIKAAEIRAAEVKPADIGAVDVKSAAPRPVSELTQGPKVAINEEQVKPEVKIENMLGKPGQAQNQAFQDLWEKANPIQNLNGKNISDLIPGSRPVSEISRSAVDTILPAGAIESPLSTKPSLATQPLLPVSSNSTSMPAPTLNMRQAGWETSLAKNVSWMTGNNLKTVQVHITPAELGPIHIHASMEQDKLNLQINAQNGVTRETLESALPRIRDILSDGNFASVNVDVSNDGLGQRQFSENENIEEFNDSNDTESSDLAATSSTENRNGSKIGLVDTFA